MKKYVTKTRVEIFLVCLDSVCGSVSTTDSAPAESGTDPRSFRSSGDPAMEIIPL